MLPLILQSGSVIKVGHVRLPKIRIEKIEKRRGNQVREIGYRDVPDFVEDITDNWTEIRQGTNNSLLLVKKNGKSKIAAIDLELFDDGKAYEVKTALVGCHFPIRESISPR